MSRNANHKHSHGVYYVFPAHQPMAHQPMAHQPMAHQPMARQRPALRLIEGGAIARHKARARFWRVAGGGLVVFWATVAALAVQLIG